MVKQLISLFSHFDYDDKRKFALFLYRISYMNRAFAGLFGFLAEATIITLNLTVLNLSINTISAGAVILILIILFIEKILAEKYKYFLDKYGKITDERNLPNVKDGSIAGSLLLFVIPIILMILTYTGNIKFSSQLLFLEASFFNTSGIIEKSYLIIRTVLYSCIILFCVASFLQAFSVWYYNWIQIDDPYNLPFYILHKTGSVVFSAFIEGKLIAVLKRKVLNKIKKDFMWIHTQDKLFIIRMYTGISSLIALSILAIIEYYFSINHIIFLGVILPIMFSPLPVLIHDIFNPHKLFKNNQIPDSLKSPCIGLTAICVYSISLILILENESIGLLILIILNFIPLFGWPFSIILSIFLFNSTMKPNDEFHELINQSANNLPTFINIEHGGAVVLFAIIYAISKQISWGVSTHGTINFGETWSLIKTDFKNLNRTKIILTQLFHLYSTYQLLAFIDLLTI